MTDEEERIASVRESHLAAYVRGEPTSITPIELRAVVGAAIRARDAQIDAMQIATNARIERIAELVRVGHEGNAYYVKVLVERENRIAELEAISHADNGEPWVDECERARARIAELEAALRAASVADYPNMARIIIAALPPTELKR